MVAGRLQPVDLDLSVARGDAARHLPDRPGGKLLNGRPDPAAAQYQPLPQLFRNAGFLTAGFTGGGFMSDKMGFAAGFDTYFMFQQPPPDAKQCSPDRFDGAKVFDLGAQWLRQRATAPFFLFLHTYEVHDRCPVQPVGIKVSPTVAGSRPRGSYPRD